MNFFQQKNALLFLIKKNFLKNLFNTFKMKKQFLNLQNFSKMIPLLKMPYNVRNIFYSLLKRNLKNY